MVTMPSRSARSSHYWIVWSGLIGCGIALVGTAVYFSGIAQPLRRVKIAEIVGEDNRVLADSKVAPAGTEISIGQQVSTLEAVRVGLQQANQVIARLGAQSSVTRESDCIQLGEGQVLISNTAGCVGAAIARSKEGVFLLERLGPLGEVKVLSGEVNLTIPSNPALGTVTLKANQKVTLNLTGDDIGPVRLMLPSEVTSIVTGELFQGFQLAIANQNTLVGLLPSAAPTTPTPVPSTQPTPGPTKPLATKPPADKVPPQPVASSVPPADTPVSYPAAVDSDLEGAEPNYSKNYARSAAPATSTYKRPVRRRYVEPASEFYTPRKSWARSPYSGSYARRRSPSYSAPSYSAPSHPAPSGPAPDDLPSVPEMPTTEMPTPIELPPVAPPVSDPLPPPIITEPPMPAPDVR